VLEAGAADTNLLADQLRHGLDHLQWGGGYYYYRQLLSESFPIKVINTSLRGRSAVADVSTSPRT